MRAFRDTGRSFPLRRPALDALWADMRAQRLDVIVVCAFDRLGRSTKHLVECLDLFRHLGVTLISLREQIDTATYVGEALFTIIAPLAQLERSFIRERVLQGIRRARAEGKRLGQPLAVDPARLSRRERLTPACSPGALTLHLGGGRTHASPERVM